MFIFLEFCSVVGVNVNVIEEVGYIVVVDDMFLFVDFDVVVRISFLL